MNPFEYLKKNGLRHTLKVLWQYKVDKVIQKIILPFVKRRPLEDTIIIESHNDFDCNGGALYDYLIRNNYNQKNKIVWLLHNEVPTQLPNNVEGYKINKPSIKKDYYICTAKWFSADHFFTSKVRKEQKSFYLTHGAISLKSPKGLVILPEDVDYYLCPSDYYATIQADILGLPVHNSRELMVGYPSNDILYQPSKGEFGKITKQTFSKIILWMPTFRTSVAARNDSNRELALGIPILNNFEQFEQLNDLLKKKEVFLVIKIHPMQDMNKIKIKDMSNIKVLDGVSVKKMGIDNYRLMVDSDALISDYSSVSYDYLHLNRPIAYSMDDAKDYKLKFVVDDPHELMAGHLLYNFDDLEKFVHDIVNERDPYEEEREQLLERLYKYRDGNSCERLVQFMGLSK